MIEYSERDYYNEFTKYCDNQIIALNNEVHIKLEKLYELYYILLDNYNYLVMYNIKINDILRLEIKGIKLKVNPKNSKEEYFIKIYNMFLDILVEIQKLSKTLNLYSLLNKIPYRIFKIIQYSINYEVSINLLKGRSFYFPKIGEIYIARVPYDNSIPDWGNSFKFRDFLKEQGIETKSDDNPTGKNWLIGNGLNRDDFVLLRWHKSSSPLRNKEPYRLVPSVRGNIYGKKLDRAFTLDELFTNTRTGLFDKIIHIYKYHYEYANNTYPFVKISKREIENENEINL